MACATPAFKLERFACSTRIRAGCAATYTVRTGEFPCNKRAGHKKTASTSATLPRINNTGARMDKAKTAGARVGPRPNETTGSPPPPLREATAYGHDRNAKRAQRSDKRKPQEQWDTMDLYNYPASKRPPESPSRRMGIRG